MNTLDYIIKKFGLDITPEQPTQIHNVNRSIMAETLKELEFKVGAEVGVAQGHHARMLCEKNPGVKLFAVDIWDNYPGYSDYSDRIDKYYLVARDRLANYNCTLIKKFSMDAVKDFADGSLDFVYIDGAHDFKNVADDICEWSKKVRIGGIVFGHDYFQSDPKSGKYIINVKYVIQAFTGAHEIRPWFVLTNDIKDPVFGKDTPGWLFVRQDTDHIS